MDKLLSGRRILVVEDEMMVLMVTEDMLADLGCESVTAAATVDQALALIEAQGFDAAMLDVNLNGSKSYPGSRRARRARRPFRLLDRLQRSRQGRSLQRPAGAEKAIQG